MKKPFLSVIMGIYNCPTKDMLIRAVNSILNQTYTDFEFIICDDGSTNDTFKWLCELKKIDNRIRVFRSDHNEGLACALNECIKRAQGELIARQDVDDYSMPNRFELEIEFLNENQQYAFVGSNCFLYENNEIYGERYVPAFPCSKDFLFNSPFIHGTVIFRREVFEKAGNYRSIGRCLKYEDYDFFMRLYAKGMVGANINQLLYVFYSEEKKNHVCCKMRLDEVAVRYNGFKALGLLPAHFLSVIKPFVLMFVPNKLLYHLKNLKKSEILNRRAVMLNLYKAVVNRNSYIKYNYESFVNAHRRMHSRFPLISWLVLLRLNIVSILLRRTTREPKRVSSENISLCVNHKTTPKVVAKQLCGSDVVSFDIFDTLIFRPFSKPKDLFYLVGAKLNYPDFRTIRITAEERVRAAKKSEITLKEIYDYIEEKTGIDSQMGQDAEMEIEYNLCTANPFMKKVWDIAVKQRRVVVTSDMYLPSKFLAKVLKNCGFRGFEKIYVSCEHGCGKYNGGLYEKLKTELKTQSIAHIGDNFHSDVQMAKKHGLSAVEYKNVNAIGENYRPKDMSPIIRSAYSGLINMKLYNGDLVNLPAYNFGYKYGGVLQLGFCEFIRKIAREKKADKILFFSRDGYMTKQIYDKLYHEIPTEYVYWSRNCAAKLGAELFKNNFMSRFVLQKVNHNILIGDIFSSIGYTGAVPFDMNTYLSSANVDNVEAFVEEHWDEIVRSCEKGDAPAKEYYSKVLDGCKRVITIDCGWAGSGNIILEQIVNKKWGIDCEFIGILAGTNSYNQFDSDYSESYFITEKMLSYCFSSSFNRDKYMAHLPSSKHNIYFELLFSAPEPSFLEFGYGKDGKPIPIFDRECENKEIIDELQRGEMDFVTDYINIFKQYSFMRNISGSDAYTPFMNCMKVNQKELKAAFSGGTFDELTNGKKEKI